MAALDEAITILRKIDDPWLARALVSRGWVAMQAGSLADAAQFGAEGLATGPGDDVWAIRALVLSAVACGDDLKATRPLFEQGVELARRMGDPYAVCESLSNLAWHAVLERDFVRACSAGAEALSMARALAFVGPESAILHMLGVAELGRGHPREAADHFAIALHLAYRNADRVSLPLCLHGLGGASAALGAHRRAAVLVGAADFDATVSNPVNVAGVEVYADQLERARAKFGDAAWEEALAEGRAMSEDDAVALALSAESADR